MNRKPTSAATIPASVSAVPLADLQAVTGGLATPDMGATKYSAAWYEFVRSRGGNQAK